MELERVFSFSKFNDLNYGLIERVKILVWIIEIYLKKWLLNANKVVMKTVNKGLERDRPEKQDQSNNIQLTHEIWQLSYRHRLGKQRKINNQRKLNQTKQLVS